MPFKININLSTYQQESSCHEILYYKKNAVGIWLEVYTFIVQYNSAYIARGYRYSVSTICIEPSVRMGEGQQFFELWTALEVIFGLGEKCIIYRPPQCTTKDIFSILNCWHPRAVTFLEVRLAKTLPHWILEQHHSAPMFSFLLNAPTPSQLFSLDQSLKYKTL